MALPRTVSVDGEEVAAAWVSAGELLLGAKNKEWGVKGREGISSNSRGTQGQGRVFKDERAELCSYTTNTKGTNKQERKL